MPQEAFQEASRLSSSGSEDVSLTTSASSETESKSSSKKGSSVPRTKTKSQTKAEIAFVSKERESHQFTILGIRPIRRGDNRLQFDVPIDLVDRFMKHHHVESGRIRLEK